MIETGLFVRKCPCCAAELEIKLSHEKDDITIISVGKQFTPEDNYANKQTDLQRMQVGLPPLHPDTLRKDKKCALCFTPSIYGGVLCNQHNFCGSCERAFPDGRPYQLKDMPLCAECSR